MLRVFRNMTAAFIIALVFVTVGLLLFAPDIIFEKFPKKKEYSVVVDSAVSLPSIDYGKYGRQSVDTTVIATTTPIYKARDSIIEPKFKIFVIGYMGWDKDGNMHSGFMRQDWTIYPEYKKALRMIKKKHKYPKASIVSISEITDEEYELLITK